MKKKHNKTSVVSHMIASAMLTFSSHLLIRQVFPTATSPTTITLAMLKLRGYKRRNQLGITWSSMILNMQTFCHFLPINSFSALHPL